MSEMLLAARLAARELRGGMRGFRIVFICLVMGVAAIAGVGSLSASITAGLMADARLLLGGDFDIRLHNRPANERQIKWISEHAANVSSIIGMRAMTRAEGAEGSSVKGAEGSSVQGAEGSSVKGAEGSSVKEAEGSGIRSLVELKAVDAAYPLTGAVVLEPAMDLAAAFALKDGLYGTVVERTLLSKLGIKTGDRIKVGEAVVQIRAVITHEPDRVVNLFSLGPRVMMSHTGVTATQLVQPGSQIHYHQRVSLPPGTDNGAWADDLDAAFPEAGWRVRGTDRPAPGVQRFIERMALFLSFVGLTALLVGGIGVSNAVGSYLSGKTPVIATLKCIGAPSALIFRIYLMQIVAIAGGGIVVGVILGAVLPALAVGLLAGLLPVTPVAGVYLEPLALAAVYGLLIAVTFSLWPLGRAGRVPAAALFRDRVSPEHIRPGRAAIFAAVLGVVALAAITLLTASDKWFAAWFVGGAIVVIAGLRTGAFGLMTLTRRAKRPRSPGLRLAFANIHRRGSATPGVVLSLGLGLSVMVAVALVEGNLSQQVRERIPDQAPAFFFIDIQPTQVDGFSKTVLGVEGAHDLQKMPSLRGRIVRINGVEVEHAHVANGSQWAVRGDRALTYSAKPLQGSKIVDGKWWPENYSGKPLISLDAGLAKGFRIGIGDTLTLNVLGREITAEIASLRDINWRSLRFDFAIIFAPGALEGAPHSFIAAVKVPVAGEPVIERAITDSFANISAIRVRDALVAASRLLEGIGLAVRGSALIAIAAGALVLGGAIAAGRRRRIYDSVIFKVLGATRGQVLRAYLIEYGILGSVTGIAAAVLGTLIGWAVVVFLLRMDWVFMPGMVAATVGLCILITVAAGFAGTWRALGQKAAPLLRNE